MKTKGWVVAVVFVALTALASGAVYSLQGCGGSSDSSGGGDDAGGGGEDSGCEPDCNGKECGDDGCGGNCSPGCSGGASCNAGTCVESNPCATVGESCGAGKGCYYEGATDDVVCYAAGAQQVGEPCVGTSDCVVGAACLTADDGDSFFCYSVCSAGNGCGANSTCEDTGLGFKICVCSCDRGFQCGSGDECVVDPYTDWKLTLTDGTVAENDPNGEAWDFPGGMPEPFVCVTVNEDVTCSPTVQDTLSPSWDFEFGSFLAADLEAGVGISMWDEDLSDDDMICEKGTITIKNEHFLSGGFTADCDYATVHFTLEIE